jgi:acyl carrier protein
LVHDRTTVRETVRTLIDSVKALEPGYTELKDDDPLFNYGSGRPSPINLDSLDALDLAMSLSEHFGLDNEEFERLVESEDGMQALRTVNDITELILSLTESESMSFASTPTERR